jgi:hypothetical protein
MSKCNEVVTRKASYYQIVAMNYMADICKTGKWESGIVFGDSLLTEQKLG